MDQSSAFEERSRATDSIILQLKSRIADLEKKLTEDHGMNFNLKEGAPVQPSKAQPPWATPTGTPLTDLKVLNSLTRTKVPFVAKGGRHVTWYMCGPTVYDASHLGHARNYMSFDVIRRILTEYFRYDVTVVMNITDIDDKIIIRSNEAKIHFTELARKWEASFLEDMKALKVQPPDVLTRVSEYVPEIISFIQGIEKNGFAYTSNGSVYFDTVAFAKSHAYGKLAPWAIGELTLIAEGEGALSVGLADKRSISDFALWKKSKEGEPRWDSPWGEGRPGWHIECSAMAGSILGECMDIHSGGEDLRFPHHDNELAQSEAYFNNQQWVNYFLHSGHLHISGRKMAKSLKNFITIQEALKTYDARKLRLLFLLHKYDSIMDYSTDSMDQVLAVDKIFSEFFHNMKALIRLHKTEDAQSWTNKEKQLHKEFIESKKEIHEYLCDNFDTPSVLKSLQELVRKVNIYLNEEKKPKVYLLRSIAAYISSMFKIFGVVDTADVDYSSTDATVENSLTPLLDAFTNFRTDVRLAVKSQDNIKVLQKCDEVRDQTLPLLGIRLSDRPDGTSFWKLEDKEVLRKEVEQKIELEKKKQAAKEEKERQKREKEAKSNNNNAK